MKGNFFNLIKDNYEKAIAFIILNEDRLNILSPRSGIRQRCTLTSVKHHTGGPRQCNNDK